MRHFFCCMAILALIVPVANAQEDESVILKEEFSEWRDQKIFISDNPWGTGTCREGRSDEELLMETVKCIDAGGFYLDTRFRLVCRRRSATEQSCGEVFTCVARVGPLFNGWVPMRCGPERIRYERR